MVAESDSTASLVRAAQQGDRAAFRALYEQYEERVFRTALRLLGRRPEAEDLTQEVFVTAYRKLDTFDHRSSFATWLYRTTVNACYDAMRKKKRRSGSEGEMPDRAPDASLLQAARSDSPADQAQQRELRQQVDTALQTLSPKLRTTFVLREIEGLSYQDIAQAMDCAEGTVASRLARAREQLADLLRKAGVDPPSSEEP